MDSLSLTHIHTDISYPIDIWGGSEVKENVLHVRHGVKHCNWLSNHKKMDGIKNTWTSIRYHKSATVFFWWWCFLPVIQKPKYCIIFDHFSFRTYLPVGIKVMYNVYLFVLIIINIMQMMNDWHKHHPSHAVFQRLMRVWRQVRLAHQENLGLE